MDWIPQQVVFRVAILTRYTQWGWSVWTTSSSMTGYASEGELGCLSVRKGILPKHKMDGERPVQLASSPRTPWDSLICFTDRFQVYVRMFYVLPPKNGWFQAQVSYLEYLRISKQIDMANLWVHRPLEPHVSLISKWSWDVLRTGLWKLMVSFSPTSSMAMHLDGIHRTICFPPTNPIARLNESKLMPNYPLVN